jgi:hypothetical protein
LFCIFSKSEVLTVEHAWRIDNFRQCFAKNGDHRRSTVFSIGENDWRMRLARWHEDYFNFGLEPAEADRTKGIKKLDGNFKLGVRNGNNEGLAKIYI